jgi:hypothetical protein
MYRKILPKHDRSFSTVWSVDSVDRLTASPEPDGPRADVDAHGGEKSLPRLPSDCEG